MHIRMYFIAPMLHLLLLMMCSYKDVQERISVDKSSAIKLRSEASTDFLFEPFSYTISYVDPNNAVMRVGENNAQLFSWHWPGDDKSIPLIATSIFDKTILSIVHPAIAGLPDPSETIQQLLGCWEDPNGNGGPYARDVTPISNNKAGAGCVKEAMKLNNPILFASIMMANKLTTQLMPRCLWVEATATFYWMTSSNLQPRIW